MDKQPEVNNHLTRNTLLILFGVFVSTICLVILLWKFILEIILILVVLSFSVFVFIKGISYLLMIFGFIFKIGYKTLGIVVALSLLGWLLLFF